MNKEPTPRIPRLGKENRTAAQQKVIDVFSLPGQLNVDDNHVLNTLARHPDLAHPFLTFNRHLLKSSTLPVRLRQIAIMRVAWIRKSRYVWASHLRTSLRAGLLEGDFEPIAIGETAMHWNSEEKSVLRATDQLVECSDLDDESWQALSRFLDTQQLLDFLFTVGNYIQLSLVCNAIRIEREEELQQLADRLGSPN
jgi:4-carboxymuconolactone decarboxylase